MLDRHGVDAVFTSRGSGTYVVGVGYTEGTPDPLTVRVYYSEFNLEEVDGQSILQGDRKAVFIPPEGSPKPKNGDTIGDTRVEGVREIMSQDAVVYICHVRDFSA